MGNLQAPLRRYRVPAGLCKIQRGGGGWGWGVGVRCTYVGGEPVGRRGLVDVVLVVVRVWAALRGLPLAPAHRAALHHAADRKSVV